MKKLKSMPWILVCAAVVPCCGLSIAALIQSPARAQSAGILNSSPITAADGKQVYEQICQGCHMPDAKGAVGAASYPALADDKNLASAEYVETQLFGGRKAMPALGRMMSDQQAADVINYVRAHFGNDYRDEVSAADIEAARRQAGSAP